MYEAFNRGMLENEISKEEYRNFYRNKQLIELEHTSDTEIFMRYIILKQTRTMQRSLIPVEKRCNMLIESVQDFYTN